MMKLGGEMRDPKYLIGKIPSLKPRTVKIANLILDGTPEKKMLLLAGLGDRPNKFSNS